MFVAGVYNYEADTYELYHGSRRSTPGTLSEYRIEPENAFWIGTENDAWGVFASGIRGGRAADYSGRALGAPEVMALNAPPSETTTGSASTNETGTTVPDTTSPMACDVEADCPRASYCGLDSICYPTSQLPKDYAAAIGATGSPDSTGDPEPGSGSGGSSGRPGLMNPNSGPADNLAPDLSAGEMMAGRWTYDLDSGASGSGGITVHTTLKIYGRDNALSGTITTTSGAINDEPLTNISKLGSTVSFSSPSYGTWSGQVFENGRMMSLQPTTPNMSARIFRKRSDVVGPDDTSTTGTPTEPESDADSDSSDTREPRYIMLSYDTSVLAYSGVSGGVGDRTEQVVFSQLRRFPYWIETRENYDKPCTVIVHAREVRWDSFDSEPLVTEYDVCDGGSPRINPVTTLSRLFRNPEAGDFRPMTGIEVCNNGINNRVKGIRARVRSLPDLDGTYTPNYSDVEFEQRANCVSWKSMAHCSANTYGIGLRLHFRDGDIQSPRDFLSGLEIDLRGRTMAGIQ